MLLLVVWKPEFSIHPQDNTKYFDDDATNVFISFSCAANGSPLPVISWLENNSKVDDDKAIQKDNISILTLVFNEGTEKHCKYRCVAKNSLGNTSSQEATLMITKRRKNHSTIEGKLTAQIIINILDYGGQQSEEIILPLLVTKYNLQNTS